MENASKALIIAGAILLSILIIGLGMLVFNQARDAISGSNLDVERAEAFNSKFRAYTGNQVTGSQVKNLIDLIANNNNTIDTTENPKITVMGDGADKTATLPSYRNSILNASRYTVIVDGYDSAGRVVKILITKN